MNLRIPNDLCDIVTRAQERLQLSRAYDLAEIARSLEPLRATHMQSIQLLDRVSLGSTLKYIVDAQKQVDSIFSRIDTNAMEIAKNNLHPTWSAIDRLATPLTLDRAAMASLAEITRTTTLAENLISRVDLRQLSGPFDYISKYQKTFDRFTKSYRDLTQYIGNVAELTALPAETLSGASREVFTGSWTLSRFTSSDQQNIEPDTDQLVGEIRDDSDSCLVALSGLSPQFGKLLLGAREALTSTNSDRTRHFLISLRELWAHLLRSLAPNNEVLVWAASQTERFITDGKPTRLGRVAYICRRINCGPLARFMNRDTQALIELIDILQRVHELEHDFTDKQLKALLLRVETWIVFLVKQSRDN